MLYSVHSKRLILALMVVSSNVRSSVANESISLDYNINASGMQICYEQSVTQSSTFQWQEALGINNAHTVCMRYKDRNCVSRHRCNVVTKHIARYAPFYYY